MRAGRLRAPLLVLLLVVLASVARAIDVTPPVTAIPIGQIIINAKQHGATGDGTTNDTAALQAAITAATTSNAILWVPPGTYVVTTGFTYTTSSTRQGLRIIGTGPRSTVFDWRGAGALFTLDNGATSVFQHHGRFADFRITTTTSPASSHGFSLRGAWHYRIENVWIDSLTGDGIRIDMTSGDADSVAHLDVASCRLESLGGYGFNDATSAGVSALSHLTIAQSYIRANAAGGIRWTGQIGRFIGNSIAQNGGTDGGLYIRYNAVGAQNSVTESNEFDSNANHHIKIDAGFAHVVRNNHMTFQNVTPPGSYGPTRGIILGDGTNTLDNAVVQNNRVRSTPTNPSIATTFLDIKANATSTLAMNTSWMAFSGGNATRLSDLGAGTMVLDDAIWTRLFTTLITMNATTFTNLGTPADGNLRYCSDCTTADPCASGGAGALARRLNGAWVCAEPRTTDTPQVARLGIGTAAGSGSSIRLNGFTFANIASNIPTNGDFGFCSDCTIANPCAGGGAGAIAKRLNGINVCN